MNRYPDRLVQFLVSIAILSLLVTVTRFDRIMTVLSYCNGYILLLSVMTLPLLFWMRAYRWAWIINKGGRHFRIRDLFLLTLTGAALSLVVPASLGEVGRSYFGWRVFGHREEMLSTSIADKIYGLFSVFVLGAGTAFLLSLPVYCIFSFGSALLLGIFLMMPHLFPWRTISRFSGTVAKEKLDSERMIRAFELTFGRKVTVVLLSLMCWVGTYFLFFLICRAFQSDISFQYLLAVSPLITVARLFPLTLSGFGSQEAVVLYLFHQVGIQKEIALLVSLAFQVVATVIPGIVGIYIMSLFRNQAEVSEVVN